MSNYIEQHSNIELFKYFKTASSSYPHFIDKYINTPELKRLGGIGFFCGCDYTKLFDIKYWYSRLDHSIICALMTWSFTKDKQQTLAALFHDLGTPAFSHCIDFLLGDSINQESAEIDIEKIINGSDILMEYLDDDNVSIEDISYLEKYTILENKKPKLCIDRLDGVFSTGIIWKQFWTIDDVKYIYSNIVVLKNEDGEDELGFNDLSSAFKFFEGIYKYSIVLQQNEDKFTLRFISDSLKYLSEAKLITIDELYKLSEKEVVNLIKLHDNRETSWNMFVNATKLHRSNKKPNVNYFISIDSKKRYVIPLVLHEGIVVRLNTVSSECQTLLDDYMNYNDSKYCYITDEN